MTFRRLNEYEGYFLYGLDGGIDYFSLAMNLVTYLIFVEYNFFKISWFLNTRGT